MNAIAFAILAFGVLANDGMYKIAGKGDEGGFPRFVCFAAAVFGVVYCVVTP